MKYLFILATILFMIFMPNREVKVKFVEANEGSEEQISITPTPSKMPQIDKLPSKRINDYSPKVEGLIRDIFGTDADVALAIARAESGLRCDAVGDRHLSPSSYGVFQIRAFINRPGIEELTDCETNIRYAKFMFDRQGWQPWSAYTNKAYLRFL